jgi:cyanophycinase
MKLPFSAVILFTIALFSCNHNTEQVQSVKGKLFIIGGGERTDSMMNELVDLAGIRHSDYAYILPMSSSVPDSSIMWTREDFFAVGVKNVYGYNFTKESMPAAQLDSVRKARLIFISGGDQSRFMDIVKNSPVYDAIHEAYSNGAVISGTSAGAAVMSKKMITGNQKKHPESDARFNTIESGNVEVTEGLGFLTTAIIDQHFIKRQRLNRLISVSVENPEQLCIGIDESTAIVVDGNTARVTGLNQVVVINNTKKIKKARMGLLGTEGLEVSVYLPGQSFQLR